MPPIFKHEYKLILGILHRCYVGIYKWKICYNTTIKTFIFDCVIYILSETNCSKTKEHKHLFQIQNISQIKHYMLRSRMYFKL